MALAVVHRCDDDVGSRGGDGICDAGRAGRPVVGRVRVLVEGPAGSDLSSLDPVALEAVAADIRAGQRTLGALLVLVAERAAELAADGSGPGPDELMVGRREVRADTARADAARAVTAGRFPLIRAAFMTGEIGGEHLDVLGRALRELTDVDVAALGAIEAEVVAAASGRAVELFARWLRNSINRIRSRPGPDPAGDDPAGDDVSGDDVSGDDVSGDGASGEPKPVLRAWVDRHGRGHLSLETDLITHEELVGLIEAHRALMAAGGSESVVGLRPAEPVAHASLAARALIDLVTACRSAGNGGVPRAAITLIVDAATALHGPHGGTVCETARGTPVPVSTASRFACNAVLRKVVLGPGGVPLDVGRSRRTATPAQWAALTAIYSTCAWYGCDRPITWCQAHHIATWDADDGPTDLDNLVPLCSRHHHLVHEGGWSIRLVADRTLELTTPDGDRWRTARPDRLTAGSPTIGNRVAA